MTQAALRGSDYISNDDPRKRVAVAAQAAKNPGLTYLYLRDTDKVGHNYGWDSDKWIGTYERVDGQLGLLRRSVPKGTLIVIVADHGMITTDPESVIDIAQDQRLMQGVVHVGGEPRCVMLYAEQGEAPENIAARWRDVLGDRAQVRTRSQAIAEGVYGPVVSRVEPMIGDVIVSATKAVTIVDSRTQAESDASAERAWLAHYARVRYPLSDRRGLTCRVWFSRRTESHPNLARRSVLRAASIWWCFGCADQVFDSCLRCSRRYPMRARWCSEHRLLH